VPTRTILAAFLVALAALNGACERADSPATTSTQGESPLDALTAQYGEPVKTYVVRGEVERLPDPEQAGTDFVVHHEAIDDFIGHTGEVVGMSSMTMPFTLADGLKLPEGLKPGDKVTLHLAQWIKPLFRNVTYKVERLPDDTELKFGRANPPGAAPAESPEGKPTDADSPG
jgi:Cu/Ag efflux protein CusF